MQFKIWNLCFYFSSVAGAAAGATTSSVAVATAGAVFSDASASLSDPLSERPSVIAAVTKVKILSIDLEASSFDGITILYFTRIRVSINHCKNWNV